MQKRLPLALLLAAAGAVLPLAVLAQGQDFSKVEIQSTDLGRNMYALTGAGGNITVAVGSDGVIMVDTEFAPLHDKIKAKIASLSPLPVKYVLNTHFHGDHTGGNEAFAKEGAIIMAHENVGKRMTNPPPGANGQARHARAQGRAACAKLFRPGHRSESRGPNRRAGPF